MKQLMRAFDQMNIPWEDSLLVKFEKFMEAVLEWNKKVNLTAITNREDFIKKHFIDSLLCYDLDPIKKAENIIDIGTGAGFPGIPLALVYPEKNFLLVDSLNKRIKIIHEMKDSLGIDNVTLLHGRAEELGHKKEYREQFDLCVSRAVANLSVLSEYCLPFVRVGGFFAAYKTQYAQEEIEESKKAISILGGKIASVESVNINCFDLEHRIVLIEKWKQTLAKYARKPGTPEKVPLK